MGGGSEDGVGESEHGDKGGERGGGDDRVDEGGGDKGSSNKVGGGDGSWLGVGKVGSKDLRHVDKCVRFVTGMGGDSEVKTVVGGLDLRALSRRRRDFRASYTGGEGAAAKRLDLGGFGRVTAASFCELAMAAILNLAGFERAAAGLWELAKVAILKMAAILCELRVAVVLSLAVSERVAVAAGRCEGAMAARFRELEARAAAVGLKLGGFGWTAAGLGFVGFELVGVIVHVEAVFEVEVGGLEGLCSSRQVVASSPSDSEDNSSSTKSSACCRGRWLLVLGGARRL